MACAAARSRGHSSPLEELKALLQRTSHVETALGRLEASETQHRPGHNEDNGWETQQGSTSTRAAALRTTPSRRERSGSIGDFHQDDCISEGSCSDSDTTPLRGSQIVYPQQENRFSAPRLAKHSHLSTRAGKTAPNESDAAKPLKTTKSIPRTPLAVSIAKMQQSEEQWLKEKVQLRREADQQRKRASALDHKFSQMQALYKHQGTELKAMKAALHQRDARAEELENQLKREHEEATASVESYAGQIQSLKGKASLSCLKVERQELQHLLSAALHQLQSSKRPSSHGSSEGQAAELEEARAIAMQAQDRQHDAEERLKWQTQTLDSLLEKQLALNRRKAVTVENILDEDEEVDQSSN